MTRSSTNPNEKPTNDNQCESTAVRSPIVLVTNMNTAAIFMQNVFIRANAILRPSWYVSGWTRIPSALAKASISPRVTATAAKSMATKSKPLPRNTVAKKRSSNSPMWLRRTAINHRNAIPVNGTRFKDIETQSRKAGSESHTPGSFGSAGAAKRISTRLAIKSPEKTIPLVATIRGGDGIRFNSISAAIQTPLLLIFDSNSQWARARPQPQIHPCKCVELF